MRHNQTTRKLCVVFLTLFSQKYVAGDKEHCLFRGPVNGGWQKLTCGINKFSLWFWSGVFFCSLMVILNIEHYLRFIWYTGCVSESGDFRKRHEQ
jgi:hypothetical protein